MGILGINDVFYLIHYWWLTFFTLFLFFLLCMLAPEELISAATFSLPDFKSLEFVWSFPSTLLPYPWRSFMAGFCTRLLLETSESVGSVFLASELLFSKSSSSVLLVAKLLSALLEGTASHVVSLLLFEGLLILLQFFSKSSVSFSSLQPLFRSFTELSKRDAVLIVLLFPVAQFSLLLLVCVSPIDWRKER